MKINLIYHVVNSRTLLIWTILLLFSFSGISCLKGDIDKNENLPVSSTNLNELFQLAIDLPALQEYYHPDSGNRKVLCISGENVSEQLQLIKNSHPVKVVSSSVQCENCVTFNVANISDSTAHFEMTYEIEGVYCIMDFTLKSDTWRVISSNISEH